MIKHAGLLCIFVCSSASLPHKAKGMLLTQAQHLLHFAGILSLAKYPEGTQSNSVAKEALQGTEGNYQARSEILTSVRY